MKDHKQTATNSNTDSNRYFRERIARTRKDDRDISPIPGVVDKRRRNACLRNPQKFLKTYFPDRFYTPFTKNQKEMIAAILHCATYGGSQAIAAPRGDGKTEITKGMVIYALLAGLVKFPVIVAATGVMAGRMIEDIKKRIESNELLMEDFPELCYPVRRLEGAPQRAKGQHLHGVSTHIEWKKMHVRFPQIEGLACAGGAMTFGGLDAAIRGINLDGLRPDMAIIDDPETRESASSEYQVGVREQTIDMDVAGLAGPQKSLAMVALCTLQNTFCLSAKLTNPKEKGGWNGKRYRLLEKWPERTDLWDEYIALRKTDQENGDQHALNASAFYLKNRKAMDRGAKVSNQYRRPIATLKDGTPVCHSALQFCYNFIADKSIDAFSAEFQNDPIGTPGPETLGITSQMIRSRVSGLLQGEMPEDLDRVTLGIDVGKYWCHWVKVAWLMNATGRVVDYGIIEVPGRAVNEDAKVTEVAILKALHEFRTETLAEGQVDFALIDSGDYTDAVYSFVREVGGMPWAASKGWDERRFRLGKSSDTRRLFDQAYAQHQPDERIWLYNVHVDHWKGWVHQRFLTPTRDSDEMLNAGSLSVFSAPNDTRKHVAFSHHIVAEEQREEFIVGKGLKRYWHPLNKNNHYLDAITLAAAAAGCLGVRLIPKGDPHAKKRQGS